MEEDIDIKELAAAAKELSLARPNNRIELSKDVRVDGTSIYIQVQVDPSSDNLELQTLKISPEQHDNYLENVVNDITDDTSKSKVYYQNDKDKSIYTIDLKPTDDAHNIITIKYRDGTHSSRLATDAEVFLHQKWMAGF